MNGSATQQEASIRAANLTGAANAGGALTLALHGGRIPGLDFLRALAVFLVLADHAGIVPPGMPLLLNGAVGVQIFFVLSGFLITWMLLDETQRDGRIHLIDFYRRRFARLMPVFYAYVLLGALLLMAAHKPIPWPAVGSSLVYVLNYYQAMTGAATHFLSHCWSLAVEEQFYFLWPMTLILLMRLGWRLDTSIAVSVLLIWVYRAALQLSGSASDEYLYRALETRADQLLIGCLLAVLLKKAACRAWFEQLAARQAGLHLALLALLGVLATSAAFDHILDYRYTLGYVIEPLATVLLLPLVVILAQRGRGPLARLANAPLTIKMGQASYGIYLFHQLLLYSLETRLTPLAGGSKVAGFLLAVLALSLLAHLSYTYFEMPLRKRLNHAASS